jgi:hypothetical protein
VQVGFRYGVDVCSTPVVWREGLGVRWGVRAAEGPSLTLFSSLLNGLGRGLELRAGKGSAGCWVRSGG